MRTLRLFSLVVLLCSMIGGAFFVPEMAQAADACSCYCAIPNVGATEQGTTNSMEKCREACGDYDVATCAENSAQLPTKQPMCFTAAQCSNQSGILDSTQPSECVPGMFYCYPDPDSQEAVKLQVNIGDLVSTDNLGEYMEAAYIWIIGAMTTIAIVLLMVQGLRYSFGAVSANAVGVAKKKILQIVVGITLLLSTVLILRTVNPQLLNLQVPSFPMVKTINLVDDQSCGYLTGAWGSGAYTVNRGAPTDSPHASNQPPPLGGTSYTIENLTDGTNCGSVAEITADWEGNDVTAGSSCTFNYCPTKGEICYAQGGTGNCVTCGDITNGNSYAAPSTTTCAQFSLRTTFKGAGHQQINTCFFTKDATFQPGVNNPLTGGTCAMLTIDCSKISSCEDYDTKADVANNSESGDLEDVQFAGEQPGCSGDCGDLSLMTVCNDDPCGVAPTGKRCHSDGLVVEAGALVQLMSVISGNDCDTVDL
ncbi:MAG: hypothetical protein P8J32_05595 [bacterium]|nr:hypothetical protein [bacterium]